MKAKINALNKDYLVEFKSDDEFIKFTTLHNDKISNIEVLEEESLPQLEKPVELAKPSKSDGWKPLEKSAFNTKEKGVNKKSMELGGKYSEFKYEPDKSLESQCSDKVSNPKIDSPALKGEEPKVKDVEATAKENEVEVKDAPKAETSTEPKKEESSETKEEPKTEDKSESEPKEEKKDDDADEKKIDEALNQVFKAAGMEINEGIKDFLPRAGFIRTDDEDNDSRKIGGFIGQGTDDQLKKAKIIAKVKFMNGDRLGRVTKDDLDNFDEFKAQYDSLFGSDELDEAVATPPEAEEKVQDEYYPFFIYNDPEAQTYCVAKLSEKNEVEFLTEPMKNYELVKKELRKIAEENGNVITEAKATLTEEANGAETIVPFFQGFYDSLYSDYWNSKDEVGQIFTNKINEKIKQILPSFTYQFQSIHSPKYYNYGTDEIYAKAIYNREEVIAYLTQNLEKFDAYCKNNFSSYDGFISYLPNTANEFIEKFKTVSGRDESSYVFGSISFALENTFGDNFAGDINDSTYYEVIENLDADEEEIDETTKEGFKGEYADTDKEVEADAENKPSEEFKAKLEKNGKLKGDGSDKLDETNFDDNGLWNKKCNIGDRVVFQIAADAEGVGTGTIIDAEYDANDRASDRYEIQFRDGSTKEIFGRDIERVVSKAPVKEELDEAYDEETLNDLPAGTYNVNVANIDWDCDGEDPESYGLPTEFTFTVDHEEGRNFEEEVSNALSDSTGYCHNGFNFRVVKNKSEN